MPEAHITYCGQRAQVSCDGRCDKAWGINLRPRAQGVEPDDYAFLADSEVGTAPADPGSYEGGHAKPPDSSHFPNKWCVRECERSQFDGPPPDFSRRVYNIPQDPEEPSAG